jgi:hypothetical protein
MKIKFTLFSIILFLFCTVSLKSQTNLVVNGSFENVGDDGEPVGWIIENIYINSIIEITDVAAKEGTKSVNANFQSGSGTIYQDVEGIEAGKTYTFSFKYNAYKETETNGLRFSLSWRKSTGSAKGASIHSEYLGGTPLWYTYTAEYVAPAEAAKARIILGFSNATGVYVDDVRVVEKSEVITGISSTIKAQSLFVRSENGNLVVSGAAEGSRIDLYNLFGERLQSVIAATGETVLSGLPKGQVLIVRNGNEAAKVLTK